MPTVSLFYGVAIRMYFGDHAPPHFHAFFGEHSALVAIDDGRIIEGRLPRRIDRLVQEWTDLNREALMEKLDSDTPRLAFAADEDPGSGWVPVTDIVQVRRARRIGPYRLKLWFTDGTAGEWDFSELAGDRGPMVEPFKDPAYFDRVFIEFGALTWPNGFDWSPHALHADMMKAGALEFEALNSAEELA